MYWALFFLISFFLLEKNQQYISLAFFFFSWASSFHVGLSFFDSFLNSPSAFLSCFLKGSGSQPVMASGQGAHSET